MVKKKGFSLMNTKILFCVTLVSSARVAYAQASGLVQPLVSPLPAPMSAGPTPALPTAQGPGTNSPSGGQGAQVASPAGGPSNSVGAGAQVPSTGNPSSPVGGAPGAAPSIDLQDPTGASSGNVAELGKWIDGLESTNSFIPQRVAFVVDIPPKGIPQFLLLDAKKFNSMGFFQTANVAAVAWDLKLNKKGFSNRDGFNVAMSLTKADMIIHSPKIGDWSVYLVKGDRKKPFAKGAPPTSTKEEDLVGWLTSILGWDGVVLDQRGHQLLVGSTSKILSQPQLQALAVEGSSTKVALNQNERKGSGLLSLVYFKGGIGVFDIVFLGQGVKEIPVGTKLVIEKK